MSRPSQPSGSASYGATCVSASASNAAAATTSLGSSTGKPSGFSSRSSSAILPPTSTVSARPPRLLQDAELVLDLRAARDEDERPLDVAEQRAELARARARAAGRRRRAAAARRRSVDACARCAEPKASLHEEVAVVGELARELGVVLRLARVEAGVLEHVDPLVGQQLAQAVRARAPSRTPGPAPFGRPRCEHDRAPPPRPARAGSSQRRQRGPDARVVGDAPVLERHVQVGAHEHALAAPTSASRTERGRRTPLCGDRRRQAERGRRIRFATRSTSRHE